MSRADDEAVALAKTHRLAAEGTGDAEGLLGDDDDGGPYQDAEGQPVSLSKLCRTEPEWAANRIRGLARALRRNVE